MKHALLVAAAAVLISSSAFAGTVRIHNSDSSSHVIKLKCSGSSKSVDVKGSTTATYTFHSSASSCDVVGGSIDFPTSTLANGTSWKISGGRASKN